MSAVALTARELEILQLADRGLTSGQIGIKVGLNPSTVRSHLRNARRKRDEWGTILAVCRSCDGPLPAGKQRYCSHKCRRAGDRYRAGGTPRDAPLSPSWKAYLGALDRLTHARDEWLVLRRALDMGALCDLAGVAAQPDHRTRVGRRLPPDSLPNRVQYRLIRGIALRAAA
jgi:hypothetical protein